MSERIDNLKPLCVPAHLIRRAWYGNVYEARVTHDGLPQTCNLTHIQIPLSDEQLSAAVEMFGLREEDKDDFSAWFWTRVENHVHTLMEFRKKNLSTIVELWHADMFEEKGVKNVYIMTAPYKTYAETVEGQQLTLSDICAAAVRLGNIMRDIGKEGYSHGDISMNSLYVSERDAIVLGDFYFAAPFAAEVNPERYKYILPPHVTEHNGVTGEITPVADIHSACSLLWNMATELPGDIRTPYRTPLKKVPEDLAELLITTMNNNANPLELYRKQISAMWKNVRKEAAQYAGLSFYVPQSRFMYEHVPDEPAFETKISESELLDAIAPLTLSTEE